MSTPPEGTDPTPELPPPAVPPAPPVWPPQQPSMPPPGAMPPGPPAQVPAASYPTYAAPSPYGGRPGPQPQNGMGVASLVLSLLGLVGCVAGVGSVLGIIFGLIGMKNADKGLADNKSVAKAGFIVGIVGLALWVVLGLVWLIVVLVLIANEPHSTHPIVIPSPTGF